jgi:hypothetical protein
VQLLYELIDQSHFALFEVVQVLHLHQLNVVSARLVFERRIRVLFVPGVLLTVALVRDVPVQLFLWQDEQAPFLIISWVLRASFFGGFACGGSWSGVGSGSFWRRCV